jgi:hypothetical protein
MMFKTAAGVGLAGTMGVAAAGATIGADVVDAVAFETALSGSDTAARIETSANDKNPAKTSEELRMQ